MNGSRAQSVADADRDLRQYLIRVAAMLGDSLGDTLLGLYVHGSLATGSYHRESSSIDLLAVVIRKLDPQQRKSVARTLALLSEARPMRGDLEVNVLQERYARAFEHPLPCELRHTVFGPQRHLAPAIVEVRERGVMLVGPPPDTLFGPVPWHACIAAWEADFQSARPFVTEKPVSTVLGACRVLHATTSRSMRVLNKDEAATWALQTVPRMYHSLVNDALRIYRGTKTVDDVIFEERDTIAFREYVRQQSQPAFARASETDEEEDA